jgi:hypothetical protein
MGRDCTSEPQPPGYKWAWRAIMMTMMSVAENSWLVHQSSLANQPAESSGSKEDEWKKSENFAYPYLKCLRESLTCRKILRLGTSGFTSLPKEGVVRIFIALTNPSPWPRLNPRLLGLVASTLTITPQKQLLSTMPCKRMRKWRYSSMQC